MGFSLQPPVGERPRVTHLPLLSHMAGGLLGGAALGVIATGAGWPLRASGLTPAIMGATLLAGLLTAVSRVHSVPVPSRRAQVTRAWQRWPSLTWTAAGWGAVLGVGVLTNALTWGLWALIGVLTLLSQPWVALLAGAIYGFTRAAVAVLAASRLVLLPGASGSGEREILHGVAGVTAAPVALVTFFCVLLAQSSSG